MRGRSGGLPESALSRHAGGRADGSIALDVHVTWLLSSPRRCHELSLLHLVGKAVYQADHTSGALGLTLAIAHEEATKTVAPIMSLPQASGSIQCKMRRQLT